MKTISRVMFSLTALGLLLSFSGSGLAQPVRTTIVKPKTAAPKTERPTWDDVEQNIKSTLAQTKGYQTGDLITRDDAAGVLAQLKQLGWEVEEPGQLSKRLLSSNDDLVKQLRGKQGLRFMRHIGKVPEGYDRLDRLRALPDGSKRLRELIHQPGGFTLIEYMATTPGGANMGRELSSKKHGDFNAPTHRIYTEAQLISELKTQYDAESVGSTNAMP